MSKHPKPRPPPPSEPSYDGGWGVEFGFIDPTAKCKHGPGECDRCGTSEADVKHSTVGGRGKVGRLRET